MANYFYLPNFTDHDPDFLKRNIENLQDQQLNFPPRNLNDSFKENDFVI